MIIAILCGVFGGFAGAIVYVTGASLINRLDQLDFDVDHSNRP